MKKITLFLSLIILNMSAFAQEVEKSLYSGTLEENVIFSLTGILLLLLIYASIDLKKEKE